jgi:hypothetical protein
MQPNIEEYHIFEPGLKRFGDYVKDCEDGKGKFGADRLTQIIDSFGETLAVHLKDEISTLLRLEGADSKAVEAAYQRFDEDIWSGRRSVYTLPSHPYPAAIVRCTDYESCTSQDALYPIVMGCSDKTHEGGNTFPSVPFFVPYLVHYHFERKYRGSWRFNPCTTRSKPRPLVFLS